MTTEFVPEEKGPNVQLVEALKRPDLFREFAYEPKTFAARYGVSIDDDIAKRIKDKLEGVATLEQAQDLFATVDGLRKGIAIATGSSVIGPGIPAIAIAFAL